MSKVGRNDPCACGSGKKYKKCCLAKNSTVIDLGWQKMRRTEGGLMPILFSYALERFREGVVVEAWNEFYLEVDIDIPQNEAPVEFETIFMPWFLFNWIDHGYLDFDDNRTDLVDKPIAMLYLEEQSRRLDSYQQRFIRSICGEQFSFYVVTDVIPGVSLELKDLILNRTVSVHERQGSKMIKVGNILFARVMTMDGSSIMVGSGPYLIPPDYQSYFIDLREDWQTPIKELGVDILLKFEDQLRDIYHQIIEQINNREPPQIRNTEGDELEFSKLHYQLECSAEEAFAALKTLATSIPEKELLEQGKFDNQGKLVAFEVPWLERIGSEAIKGQTTLKGTLNISENKLSIDVNSRERSSAIKRKITKRLGKRAIFKNAVIQSTKKMMEASPREYALGSSPAEIASKELQSQPEVQLMLKEMAAQHWAKWLDIPLPALKDKTPRESAKTAKGCEQLEALFLQFEGMSSDNASEPFDPDIDALRKQLGMG